MQVYGGTGISSRPLTHWADGIVLAATSVLMGMLHMSMSPRPHHTLVFLGVVSLTSAATILAPWCEGQCTSAPSSVPVVVPRGSEKLQRGVKTRTGITSMTLYDKGGHTPTDI